jgi:hypothetical protein
MMELQEGWDAVAAGPGPDLKPAVPWEDPDLPVLAGFWRTLRRVLFRPREFFANLGGAGRAEPLVFALLVSSAGLLCTLFWQLLVLAAAGLTPEDLAGLSPSLGLGPGLVLGLMAASPLLVLLELAAGGLCWWGGVALAGAGRDFTPAWRIFCYAQAGYALACIPIFGMPVAGIWVLVLLYYGVRQVYGVSAWNSLGALAVFLALQVLLAILLVLGLLAGAALMGFLLLLLG